jgi:hypothetical protein
VAPKKTSSKNLVFELEHDTSKNLKGGKRRYGDEDRHNMYFTREEVEQMGAPDTVKVTVEPSEV